jgi:hypothetical protein
MNNNELIKLFEEKGIIESRMNAYILYGLEDSRELLKIFDDKEFKDIKAELDFVNTKITNLVVDKYKPILEKMMKEGK